MRKRKGFDNIEEMIDLFTEMKDEFVDFLDQAGTVLNREKKENVWQEIFCNENINEGRIVTIGMYEGEDFVWFTVKEDQEEDAGETDFLLKIDDLERICSRAENYRDKK